MSIYNIKISKLNLEYEHDRTNWRVRLKCEPATGSTYDTKIFVYHAVPEGDVAEADTFSNIASLVDMDTLPQDEPIILEGEAINQNTIPYYRLDYVELDFPNAELADKFLNKALYDIKRLVNEYDRADKYNVEQTVTI